MSEVYLSGEAPHVTKVDGTPTSVKVRVLDRVNSTLVAELMSDIDGSWRVDDINPTRTYDIIFSHDGYKDEIISDVKPIGYREQNGLFLTIDKTKVQGSHVNFPLYVDMSLFPNEFWTDVAVDGQNMRFFNSYTNEELPSEIVTCDTVNKTGEIYILTSLSEEKDHVIIINLDETHNGYEPNSIYGSESVWDDYIGVWHGNNLLDSTKNKNNGTVTNSMLSYEDGILGKSFSLNSTTSFHFGNNPNFRNATLSLQCWSKKSSVNSFSGGIAIGDVFGTLGTAYCWNLATYNNQVYFNGKTNNVGSPSYPNTWEFNYAIADGNSVSFFKNSTLTEIEQDIVWLTNSQAKYNLVIGARSNGLYSVVSQYDEIRITQLVRCANWIKTEYNNQSSPQTFFKSVEYIP